MKTSKRFLALFLAFLMAFGNLSSVVAVAEGEEQAVEQVVEAPAEPAPAPAEPAPAPAPAEPAPAPAAPAEEPAAPAEEPAADEPSAEEPSVDEPAADEPVADEPVADEPAADENSNEYASTENAAPATYTVTFKFTVDGGVLPDVEDEYASGDKLTEPEESESYERDGCDIEYYKDEQKTQKIDFDVDEIIVSADMTVWVVVSHPEEEEPEAAPGLGLVIPVPGVEETAEPEQTAEPEDAEEPAEGEEPEAEVFTLTVEHVLSAEIGAWGVMQFVETTTHELTPEQVAEGYDALSLRLSREGMVTITPILTVGADSFIDGAATVRIDYGVAGGYHAVYTRPFMPIATYQGTFDDIEIVPNGSYAVTFTFAMSDGSTLRQPYTEMVEHEGEDGTQVAVSYQLDADLLKSYKVEIETDGFTVDENGLITGTVSGNVTVDVIFSEITAEVTVRFLEVKESGNVPIEARPEEKYQMVVGVNSTVSQDVNTEIKGFTPRSINEQQVAPNGTTVVEVLYDRNEYTVRYDSQGGSYVDPRQGKYEQDLSIWSSETKPGEEYLSCTKAVHTHTSEPNGRGKYYYEQRGCYTFLPNYDDHNSEWYAQWILTCGLEAHEHNRSCYTTPYYEQFEPTPTRPGYQFTGWYTDPGCTDKVGGTVKLTEDMTVYAGWEQTEVSYTVVYMAQHANDDGYEYISSSVRRAMSGSMVTIDANNANGKDYGIDTAHFHFASATSQEIAGDGTTVITVKYDRNVYTLKWDGSGYFTSQNKWTDFSRNNKENARSVTARYGATITGLFNQNFNPSDKNQYAWSLDGGNNESKIACIDTMPAPTSGGTANGATITVYAYKYTSDKTQYINYWLENLPADKSVERQQKTIDGRTYGLYKAITPKFSHIVWEEDFYEIAGYTQFRAYRSKSKDHSAGNVGSDTWEGSGSQQDSSYIRHDFFYNAQEYTLQLFDWQGQSINSWQVKYGASITSYLNSNRGPKPTDSATWLDWYVDPEHQETYDGDYTMPQGVALYANWNLPEFTVTYKDGEKTVTTEQVKWMGLPVKTPNMDGTDSKFFAGWYTDPVGGSRYDLTKPVEENVTVYAHWLQRYTWNVTVHHVFQDESGNTLTYDGGKEAILTVVGEASRATQTVTARAWDFDEHVDPAWKTKYFPDAYTKTLTPDQPEVTFYYKPVGDGFKYTVSYQYKGEEKASSSELKTQAASLKIYPDQDIVKELARQGYAVSDSFQFKQLTSGENEVVFELQLKQFNIKYDGVENAYNPNEKTTYTVEDDFIINPPTREGYVFTGWSLPDSVKVVSAESGNGHVAMKPHVEKGSTGDLTFVANWIDLAIIHYVADPEVGGSVSLESESPILNETAQGSTATAEPGWKFVNWTKNDQEVSTDPNFTPNKVNIPTIFGSVQYYEPATYVAHFVRDEAPVNVKYVLEGGATTEDVENYTENVQIGTSYTIPDDKLPESVTGSDGQTYTLEKVEPSKTVGVNGEVGAEITVTYTLDKDSNNIPDKYEATVTYKIENGTWDGSNKEPKTEDVVFGHKEGDNWVEDNEVTLEKVPHDMQADKGYKAEGAKWTPQDPGTVTKGVGPFKYTYTFVKDEGQQQDTQYTVHYTIEGTEQIGDKLVVEGKAWVNDDPAMIEIAEGGIPAPADKYKGYKLDPTNPEYPAAGTKVKSGSEFRVNYVKDSFGYTVNYYYDNVKDEGETKTGTDGFESFIQYEAPETKNHGDHHYVLESVTNEKGTITADSSKNVVEVFYTLDDIGPEGGPDKTPDKYQVTVTYKIENGTWDGSNNADKTETVTLTDAEGKWSVDGSAELHAPTEMTPNEGYDKESGKWDTEDGNAPTTVTKEGKKKFTYSYEKDSFDLTIKYITEDGKDLDSGSSKVDFEGEYNVNACKTKTDKDGNKYVKVGVTVDPKGTEYIENGEYVVGSMPAHPVTVTVTYSLDKNGDEIPDKYQATIVYVADGDGTVNSKKTDTEIVTIYEDGKPAESGTATASATATPDTGDGVKSNFYHWVQKGNPDFSGTDAVLNYSFQAEAGQTYTFTAHFRTDATLVLWNDDTESQLNSVEVHDAIPGQSIVRYFKSSDEVPSIVQKNVLTDDVLETIIPKTQGNGKLALDYVEIVHPDDGSDRVTRDGETEIVAHYSADENGDGIPDKYQVTVNYVAAPAEGGTVANPVIDQKPTNRYSEVVTLVDADGKRVVEGSVKIYSEAAAQKDYAFDYWEWAGSDMAPRNDEKLELYLSEVKGGSTLTFIAHFDEDSNGDEIPDKYQFTVVYAVDGNGSIKDAGEGSYLFGDSRNSLSYTAKSTATPEDGYVFTGWTVEADGARAPMIGDSKNNELGVTFTGTVGAVYTFTAHFEPENPSLRVQKTVVGSNEYKIGDTVHYRIRVTNNGNVTLTDVVVTDDKTGESWTIDTLEPGVTKMFETSLVLTDEFWSENGLVNTATAEGKDPHKNPVKRSDTAHILVDVLKPSIKLEKRALKNNVQEGDSVRFVITVTNDGPSTLYDVKLTDKALEGLKFLNVTAENGVVNIGTLAPDEYRFVIVEYENVTADDIVNGKITNTASVTGHSIDSREVKAEVTADATTITPFYDLTVLKTLTNVPEGGKFKVDDVATFDITVTNSGNTTQKGVTVTEQLAGAKIMAGDGYTINDKGQAVIEEMIPGATVTVKAEYKVTQEDIDSNAELKNIADVAGKGGNTPTNPEPIPLEEQKPELTSLKKLTNEGTAEGGKFKVDDVATFDITVTNSGNTTQKNVIVTEQLAGAKIVAGDGYTINDKGQAVIAEMIPGATVTVKAEYKVTQADIDSNAELKNIALVDGETGTDPDPTPSVDIPEEPQNPGLTTGKSVTNAPAGGFKAGEYAEFNITVKNSGNTTQKGVTVTEQLAGAKIMAGDGYTINDKGQAVIEEMIPGAEVVVKATYQVTQEDIDSNAELKNIALVDGETGTDPDPTPSVDIPEEPQNPELTVEKTVASMTNNPAKLGDTITYTITVKNEGNVTVSDITVGDELTGMIGESIGTLAPNASKSVTTTYTVQRADLVNGGRILNTAIATGTDPNGEDVTANGTATVTADSTQHNVNITLVDDEGTVLQEARNAGSFYEKEQYDVRDSEIIVGEFTTEDGRHYLYEGISENVEGTMGTDDVGVTATYTPDFNDDDIPDKYQDVVITVVGNTDSFMYNGEEHSVSGYEITGVTVTTDSETVEVEGIPAGVALSLQTNEPTITGTTAGKYPMGLNGKLTVTAQGEYKSVTLNITDGQLTITKRSIYLRATDTSTYDGQEHTAQARIDNTVDWIEGWTNAKEGFYPLADGDKIVEITGVYTNSATDWTPGYLKAWHPVTNCVKIVNANGDDVTDSYSGYLGVMVVINKRPVTLTSATDSKEYDGDPLTNHNVIVGGMGFAAGEGASYNVTGSQTLVGSSANSFTYQLDENTKASNYIITKEVGTLTVTDRETPYEITVKANSGTVTYDGQDHGVSGFETEKFTVNGHEYTVEGLNASASGRNAGDYDAVVGGTAVVKDADGNDVTAQFDVKTQDGKLTINKRSVTLRSEDGEWTYDGKSHDKQVVTVGGDDFAEGEGATYSNFASITDQGSTPNTFEFTLDGNTNPDNYEITKTEGTLTINPQSIEPDPENPNDPNAIEIDSPTNHVYDGAEHKWAPTVTDPETGETLVAGRGYTVSYSTEDFTNVTGEITVTITGTGNYSGTVERTYQITPRTVTVTTDSASKAFDGDPLTAPGKIEGLVNATDATLTVTGSQTEVGSSLNRFELQFANDQMAKNYQRGEDSIGTLTVTLNSIDPEQPTPTPGTEPDPDTPVYDGVQVGALENVVYDGQSHQQTPAVTDKNGNPLDPQYYSVEWTEDTTNVGTVTVTVTGRNGYTDSVTRTYEITQRPVTLQSGTNSWTYDGKSYSEPTVTDLTAGKTGQGMVNGEKFNFSNFASITEHGSVDNTYTISDSATAKQSNYDITKLEGTLTITEKSIDQPDPENPGETEPAEGFTVSGPDDTEYNGLPQEQKPVVVDDEGNTLTEGEDYVLRYSEDTTNVGEVTVTVEGRGNYEGSFDLTYNITRAPLTVTTGSASKTYDGEPLTNEESTVSGLKNGETATARTTGTITEVGEESNTYEMVWGTADADNYEIVEEELGTLTVNAQSIEPEDPENPDPEQDIQIDSPSDVTYDGAAHQWAPNVTDPETGETLVAGRDYTVSYSNEDFTNVTGEITVTITGQGNYSGTVTRTYQINPATATVTTASATQVYDGTALTAGGTISGLVAGETATVNTTSSITNQGTQANSAYTITWGTAQARNYNVVTGATGTLTVNPRLVTLTSGSATRAYDGTALTNGTVTVTSGSFVRGEGVNTNVTGSRTDVGTSANTFTYTMRAGTLARNYTITPVYGALTVTAVAGAMAANAPTDFLYDGAAHQWAPTVTGIGGAVLAEGTDYTVTYSTADFTNVTGAITVTITGTGNYSGTITRTYQINPRTVTLTSPTATQVYNGTALQSTNIAVGGDGFVRGEGATYDVTGSRVTVGTSRNNFTYTLNANTRASNYTISQAYGSLIVTPAPLAANAPANFLYDGAAHQWTPTVTTPAGLALVAGRDYTVTYSTGNFTDVTGAITVTITGQGNYAGTLYRTYQINPRLVTLTSPSATKDYDGTALRATDIAVGGNGFARGEGASYNVTGSRVQEGTSRNAFTYTLNAGTDAGNYTIRQFFGTLTIVGAPEPEVPEEPPVDITPDDTPLGGLPELPDDGYTLSEEMIIDENETPLGAGPGEHVCCILHFIIMLGALTVAVYYTHDRKRRQQREFELRAELQDQDM